MAFEHSLTIMIADICLPKAVRKTKNEFVVPVVVCSDR